MFPSYTAFGVTFTASSDGVTGIVKNKASVTSACVPPESENRLMATGVDGSSIGLSAFPIRATMAGGGIAGPVTVSVDVQTLSTTQARLRLYDSSNQLLATATAIPPATGVCPAPNNGDPRGRVTVSASVSSGSVAYAVMDTTNGGIVFAIDNFRIR